MKRFIFLIIFTGFIISCGSNKEDMNKIKDYIVKSSADLIHLQLNKGINTKDFNFQNNKFTMLIDSTGKPIFLIDKEMTNTLEFNYNQHKYKVILNKAEIKVLLVE